MSLFLNGFERDIGRYTHKDRDVISRNQGMTSPNGSDERDMGFCRKISGSPRFDDAQEILETHGGEDAFINIKCS